MTDHLLDEYSFDDVGLWIGVDNIGSVQRNSNNLNFSALYPRRSSDRVRLRTRPTHRSREKGHLGAYWRCYSSQIGRDCSKLLDTRD